MTDTSPIAIILAAGKGTRMNSDLPKVLHEAAGKTLLAWVLDALNDAGCQEQIVVVGYGGEKAAPMWEQEWGFNSLFSKSSLELVTPSARSFLNRIKNRHGCPF